MKNLLKKTELRVVLVFFILIILTKNNFTFCQDIDIEKNCIEYDLDNHTSVIYPAHECNQKVILSSKNYTKLAFFRSQKSKNKSIDIQTIIPEDIINLLLFDNTKKFKANGIGPNCHNFSLYFAGLVKNIVHTSEEEINFFTNSPLCKVVSNEKKLSTGDIITYFTTNNAIALNHSAIYLSPDVNIQKRDIFGPYELRDPFWYLEYGFNKSMGLNERSTCWIIDPKNEKLARKKCNMYTKAFRCIPLSKYLSNQIINRNMQDVIEKIEHLDLINFTYYSMPGNTLEYRNNFHNYFQELNSLLNKKNEHHLLYKWFDVKKISILKQFEFNINDFRVNNVSPK